MTIGTQSSLSDCGAPPGKRGHTAYRPQRDGKAVPSCFKPSKCYTEGMTEVRMKPLSIVERQRAMSRIKKIAARVVDSEPDPNEGAEAEEKAIAAEVTKMRRQRRYV